MENYFSLLKVLIKDRLRLDKKGSSRRKNFIIAMIVLAVCFAPIVVGITIMMYYLGDLSVRDGYFAQSVSFIVSVSQMVSLIFGLVFFINTVYMAKDGEITSYLPIKPSVVFFSRLSIVYLTELISSSALLLVTLIPLGIGANQGVGYFLLIPLIMIITPIIPLTLASLVAIPCMYLVGLFKNRGILSTILLVLLFALAMGGYYLFMFSSIPTQAESVGLDGLVDMIKNTVIGVGNIMIPNLWIGKIFVSKSLSMSLLYFCLVVVSNVVFLFLACVCSANVFKKTIRSRLEYSKKKKIESIEINTQGVVKQLVKKDWLTIVRTPSLGLSCFMQVIVSIIVPVIFLFASRTDPQEMAFIINFFSGKELYVALIFGVLCTFSASTNIVGCSSFSREGEEYVHLRFLPFDYKNVVKSKVILAMIFNLVSCLAFCVVIAVVNIKWWVPLVSYVVGCLASLALLYIQVLLDLKKPILKWTTTSQYTKNNPSSIFSLFALLALYVIFGIGVAVAILLDSIYFWLGKAFVIVFFAVVVTLLIVLTRNRLYKNAEKYLLNLGE